MFLKVRYFCLATITFFVIWQIYTRLPSNIDVHGVTESSSETLKNIKEELNKSRVTVSVYYEALCPDSRSFFVRHLLPVYIKMSNALNVDLIPYGHAKTMKIEEGKFQFECQHGPRECFGNKIHSCAIVSILDPVLQMMYVTCLIDSHSDPEKVGPRCAEKLSVSWKTIIDCANGSQGDELLKSHGERTEQLHPKISFVPTILLNNNLHKQTEILKNLQKELCINYKDQLSEYCPQ